MVYYIYREKCGHWKWRLIDGKGMTIVNCEQRYSDEEHCSAAVQLIQASGLAPVCVLRDSAGMEVGTLAATPRREGIAKLDAASLAHVH